MLKWAFRAHGAAAHVRNSANAAQEAKDIDLIQLFIDHAPSDDDRKCGKGAHAPENIFLVANQVSDYEESADGVQQEPGLINQGACVEGENHNSRKSAEAGPEKKYEIQIAKTLAENAIGRSEHGGEHANANGQHDNAVNEEVETTNENFLSKRN